MRRSPLRRLQVVTLNIGDDVVQRAIESAPAEVRYLLQHMPPQPKENGRLGVLFSDLDSALRGESLL